VWAEGKQDKALLEFYKKCIALRKKYQALRRGECNFLYARDAQLIMQRWTADEEIIIAFNVSNKPFEINLEHNGKCYFLSMEPYNYDVIINKKNKS
jgi:glycosidase